MTLTPIQMLCIVIAVLGVVSTSTANLTDLFGPGWTKIIVSSATLMTTILSAIMAFLTGQASQIKAVQSMPGVEKITVNEKANAALATLAVDPMQDKIEPTPAAARAVEATARDA
jgi:hypothetical protein